MSETNRSARVVAGGWVVGVAIAAGCGGRTSPAPAASPAPGAPAGGDATAKAQASAPATAASSAPTADPAAIVRALRADLAGCYEAGKKKTPEMADGHVVLNVAVSASGSASCVVPTESNGLTREVEECMTARAARERFPAEEASIALPIAVAGGRVDVLRETSAPVMEKVEGEGIKDAGPVVRAMMDDLRACLREGIDDSHGMRGVVFVAANVTAKGEVACAVATRGEHVPASVRACLVARMARARFAAPKFGAATVVAPLKVFGTR